MGVSAGGSAGLHLGVGEDGDGIIVRVGWLQDATTQLARARSTDRARLVSCSNVRTGARAQVMEREYDSGGALFEVRLLTMVRAAAGAAGGAQQ